MKAGGAHADVERIAVEAPFAYDTRVDALGDAGRAAAGCQAQRKIVDLPGSIPSVQSLGSSPASPALAERQLGALRGHP